MLHSLPRRALVLMAFATPVVLLPQLLKPLTVGRAFHGHGYCYLWQPSLVATNVIADALIGLSYVAISLTLAYFVYQGRERIPFHWMFLAFGLFIIACGIGHFMDIWTMWTPVFFLEGNVRIVTALASVGTALVLPSLIPRALALVESAQLSEERRVHLDAAQRELAALEALRRSEAERERLLAQEQALRREAEAANRMKDEFLATVSHELRTPLNAMLGWTRMLNTGAVAETDRQHALEAIERSARLQAHLIEDLLDVSRIITGKVRLDVRPLELSVVVEAALDAVRPAAEAKQIRLHKVIDPLPAPVTGDGARLQQVVWNLLSNAINFTGRGGRVEVAVRRVNSQVEIVVADTGAGIRTDFLPHVFERFRQADGTRARTHAGLGIGLAIVRHLVELHGGTVHANSAGEGHGSTFTVQLPLTVARFTSDAAPDAGVRGMTTAVPLAVSLDRVRALAVDDDRESRELVAAILQSAGAHVRTARSASEALRVLQEGGIDLLVSDIGMPEEDGYALIRQVRTAEGPERRLPAVALTAHARIEDRLAALMAGFDVHVPKPVEPAELVTVIAALVRRMLMRL